MAKRNGKEVGTLYLIHFTVPVCGTRPSQHYLGFVTAARTVEERFADHCSGTGAKITRAAAQRGIKMVVVWSKPGTRDDERKLKKRCNHKELCPKCRPKWLAKRRKWDRTKRDRSAKPVAHVGIVDEVPL